MRINVAVHYDFCLRGQLADCSDFVYLTLGYCVNNLNPMRCQQIFPGSSLQPGMLFRLHRKWHYRNHTCLVHLVKVTLVPADEWLNDNGSWLKEIPLKNKRYIFLMFQQHCLCQDLLWRSTLESSHIENNNLLTGSVAWYAQTSVLFECKNMSNGSVVEFWYFCQICLTDQVCIRAADVLFIAQVHHVCSN